MDRCNRRMLASGDITLVEQCSCGSVHVTIGAVTLRLSSAAIPSLASTLASAAAVLTTDARPQTEELLS
ncbi:MAG: hypothetical protein KF773_09145 [Deltaproteobacteria bacterium]|nr:hypothetical protein [Deltaproteobacteria bacterium]MCW5805611.1 hypothetical protein [Deltaproteobacteria bacterium]